MPHDPHDQPNQPDQPDQPHQARPDREETLDWTPSAAGRGGGDGGEGPGDRIGRYALIEAIGEGGFGTVWLAEQREPVRRQVALKLLKPGMDSRQVIARFEAERQALALLDHPNIAKVFDAGSTPTGRPYFAMEHIRGTPMVAYCDGAGLDARARLELFLPVCEAIRHAHQKGIIHRDIKPGNVLVAEQDGHAVPKVIDFGIAKATAPEFAPTTIVTELRQIIGTPAYMSPEQAEGRGIDVDTRTDVYALGVLLYELLTGTTPFATEELFRDGLPGMARIIREVDPPRPSTRISTLGGAALAAARARRSDDPSTLARSLRGDLDWIVMRCLEKDRERRYGSVGELAADVRRHLADEPVSAGPPGARYRIGKFVRRHRVPVAAGAVVALALVAAGVATGLGLRRALRAEAGLTEQLAETAKARAAEKARADELATVAEFQAGMLAAVDPVSAGRLLEEDFERRLADALRRDGVLEAVAAEEIATARRLWSRVNPTDAARSLLNATILAPAARALDERFGDQPLLDAGLRQTLADRSLALGLLDAAARLQESALATRRRMLGDLHPETLASINNAGLVAEALGRDEDAERLYREAYVGCRTLFGEDHASTLAIANNLAVVLLQRGTLDEAEAIAREVVAGRTALLGADHPDTLASISNLGSILEERGDLDGAEPLWIAALEGSRRVLGDDHPDTLVSISNLGSLLVTRGDFASAEPYYREALERSRRVLGDEHPETLVSLSNLGYLLAASGRTAEAEVLHRQTLDARRRVLGPSHPDTIVSAILLGVILRGEGRARENFELLQPLRDAAEASFAGEDPRQWALFLLMLGRSRFESETDPGRFPAVEADLLGALAVDATLIPTAERRAALEALVALYAAWAIERPEDAIAERAADAKRRLEEFLNEQRSDDSE